MKLRKIYLGVLTLKWEEGNDITELELFTEMREKWWLIKIALISAKSQVLNFPCTFQI